MAVCFLCSPNLEMAEVEALDHLRTVHPDVWGSGPRRWPNGRVVVFDETLTPGNFGGEVRPRLRVVADRGDKGWLIAHVDNNHAEDNPVEGCPFCPA